MKKTNYNKGTYTILTTSTDGFEMADFESFCEDNGIPVFYKDSLRKLFPDLPESRFPWK